MDRITEICLAEFVKEYNLDNLPQAEQFEHFATFCVLKQHHSIHFDTEDVVTGDGKHNNNGNDGGGSDTGIDAFAAIVNSVLVTDAEALSLYESDANNLDVQFIFIQAERSSNFNAAKIGTFGAGVADFFNEKPYLKKNSRVQAASEIQSRIYPMSSKFDRGNPTCKLYYVTTGSWENDSNLQARMDMAKDDLMSSGLFSSVEFFPIDALRLQALYRQTRNAVTKTFNFHSKLPVGDISGVKDAYIGFLPATEFVKVITRETGEMLPGLFESNVRDWYGYNDVNKEIKETLQSGASDMFVLMNNGITIIARKLTVSGHRLSIGDFQIVNGCQTSHVLHDNRGLLVDKVMVPVRIVGTDDENVIASIVRATNRQTEVKEDQFFALQEFPRQLEAYFKSFSQDAKKIYYERRTCQYDRLGIDKARVITEANVIRSFASMFLDEAHRTTRNYRSIREKVTKEIFAKGHKLEPYYISAYMFYALEILFKKAKMNSLLKPARFHILMASRYLVACKIPPMHANEMSRFCESFMEIMWDAARSEKLLLEAAQIVDQASGGDYQRDNIRAEPFTRKVLAAITTTSLGDSYRAEAV